MDADGWKRILISKQFAESSTDLCTTIANMIKKLYIDKDLANTLEAFLSCRLIPLDKNPGLRPIEVGEVLRRIVGKVTVSTLRDDIITSVGQLQVAQDKNVDVKLPFILCLKCIKKSILKQFF